MKELPGNRFAVYTATGRILALLCSFVTPLFLTHFLSKSDYGLYSQFYTVVTFTAGLFSFGIQSNLYYFFPNSDDSKRKKLIFTTFSLLLIQGLVAAALFLFPCFTHLMVKDAALTGYIRLIAVCVLLFVPTYSMFPLFVTRGDKLTSVLYPPAEVVLKLAAVLVAALCFGSLKAIFIGCIAAHASLFLFTAVYVFSSSEMRSAGPLFDLECLKEMLKYIAPFGVAIVLETLLRQFDKIMCISYISTEEYAIYSLAFFGIPGIYQVYDSVQEVNLLNMARSYKCGDISGTLQTYKSFTYKLLSFSLPIILAVFLYADDIITFLFTPKYSESVYYFRIYILSFIIGAFGASVVLRATGKTYLTLRAYLISAAFYLPLTYFGIRYFGLKGAIISAVTGMVLPKLVIMCFERRTLLSSWRNYFPWRKFGLIVLISLLCIAPFVALRGLIHNIWVECVLAVVYVMAVYYLEIRNDLFLLDSQTIRNKLR